MDDSRIMRKNSQSLSYFEHWVVGFACGMLFTVFLAAFVG